MQGRMTLDDRQWAQVEAFLRSEAGRGRPAIDDRRFVEAVRWMLRTGAPWRDLPSDFGPWKTVFNRFDRWSKSGKWQRLMKALQVDVDSEWFSLDATIVQAHQHAAGAKGGLRDKALVDLAVVSPPKFTSSSMPWVCPSSSRSPRVNATTASPPRSSSRAANRDASSPTKPTTRTPFERGSTRWGR